MVVEEQQEEEEVCFANPIPGESRKSQQLINVTLQVVEVEEEGVEAADVVIKDTY